MKFFKMSEFSNSSTATRLGVSNYPGFKEQQNIQRLVDNILDPLRERFGKSINVSSGYRCPAVNRAVGGVNNSQHVTGEAADIYHGSQTREGAECLFNLIRAMKLPFDQLILEHTRKGVWWCHVSYGPRNRRQVIGNLVKN